MSKYYIVPEKYKCIGDIYNSQEFKDFVESHNRPIYSGMPVLDKVMKSGIPAGNLNIMLGEVKRSESIIESFIKSQFENMIDLKDDKKHVGKMIICLDLESEIQTPPLPPEPRIVKEGDETGMILAIGFGIIAYALIYWMLMSYAFNI